MPRTVMFDITWTDGTPTLDEIRRSLGLRAEDMDETFGVMQIDPDQPVFTIRLDEHAAERIDPERRGDLRGPMSDPPIEPFGPPGG